MCKIVEGDWSQAFRAHLQTAASGMLRLRCWGITIKDHLLIVTLANGLHVRRKGDICKLKGPQIDIRPGRLC